LSFFRLIHRNLFSESLLRGDKLFLHCFLHFRENTNEQHKQQSTATKRICSESPRVLWRVATRPATPQTGESPRVASRQRRRTPTLKRDPFLLANEGASKDFLAKFDMVPNRFPFLSSNRSLAAVAHKHQSGNNRAVALSDGRHTQGSVQSCRAQSDNHKRGGMQIEYAKSSRSSCKACSGSIKEDSMVIWIRSEPTKFSELAKKHRLRIM
jgi:hypothetical protein